MRSSLFVFKELTEMVKVIAVGKCVKGKVIFTRLLNKDVRQHA